MCNCSSITDMDQKTPEEVLQMSPDELIGLLDSPREEISNLVHELLQAELVRCTSRWLICGLLDHFFQSKSKRLLNFILGAPEHHWKFLKDRIQEGLKGNDKFRYTSLLLYAVCANPPFPWVKKLPDHQIIKDILTISNPCQEKDISVVVSGLMFLVVLLPTVPSEMSVHLTKILELFWSLLQHTPSDNALKVYLQIAVISFFQRLYALYPCKLIGFLRYHSDAKSLYEKTLFPMLEKVRLHPLLLTETKDTEIRKDRWMGKDRHELIQECAQISLDTFIDIPEGMSYATHFRSKSSQDKSTVELGNYLSAKTESRIWSPGVVMSPNRSSSSITSVYSSQYSRTMSRSSIPESPLETAVEAISESSTPIESPFMRASVSSPNTDYSKDDLGAKAKCFPSKDNASQGTSGTIDANMLRKELTNVQDSVSENFFTNASANKDNEPIGESKSNKKRKSAVYTNDFGQKDSKGNNDTIEKDVAGSGDSSRRSSCTTTSESSDDEGLGGPCIDSFRDFLKSVKTKKLRFLSQCGPPPDLSKLSSVTEPQVTPRQLRRSQSLLCIADDSCSSVSSSLTRKEVTPSLSPLNRETEDVCTQTEEVSVLDPYEQLLEALQVVPNYSPSVDSSNENAASSDESTYATLTSLINNLPKDVYTSDVDLDWVNLGTGTENHLKQLRSLYALLKVEKFKKEAYAERNRRLFSKIKYCYYLCDRQKSLGSELKRLGDEVTFLSNRHVIMNKKIADQKQQINNMTPISRLQEAQATCNDLTLKKEYLKELCKKLASDKSCLQEELRCSEGKVEDAKRKVIICAHHSERNEALTSQLHSHQKQILLMGEIHREIQSQLSTYRDSDSFVPTSKYEQMKNRMEEERLRIEYKTRDKNVKLKAAMLRIDQLTDQLNKKEDQVSNHQEEMKNLEKMWQEKYKALSIRNAAEEAGIVNGFADADGTHSHHGTPVIFPTVELGPYLRGKLPSKPEGEE